MGEGSEFEANVGMCWARWGWAHRWRQATSMKSYRGWGLPRWPSSIHLPMQELWVQSLSQEDPLKKEMATHSKNSCLGNPMGRGTWQAIVHRVMKESDMTGKLNNNRGWSVVAWPEDDFGVCYIINSNDSCGGRKRVCWEERARMDLVFSQIL